MKEEEEEDNLFLDRLGITSVNPEDFERDVFAEAKNDVGESSEAGESKGEVLNKSKLYSKLRAIEYEISAVSSTVSNVKNAVADREFVPDGDVKEEKADPDKFTIQAANNDLSLQHALAADRLQSLEKAKAQVEKELGDLWKDESSEDVEQHKLIQSIVATKQKPKRQLEWVQKSGKDVSKQHKTDKKHKTVDKQHKTVGDDVDFDAMLDATSSGFMETERDELVRKGILTPFSRLEGYERRIQQTGLLSQGKNASQEPENDEARVAKAIKSFSEASQARVSTMLVDPSSLPKLDAPTYPFQRLSKALKITHSSENGSEFSRGSKRKSRRPLPGKKWRKKIAREEDLVEADGVEVSSSGEEPQGVEDINEDDEPSCVALEGGLKIPEVIFSKLFDYQKVGVQWLWELHCQRAGGIIGDEMGLGKTIQVLSFLGALHFSNMYKPSIIVCPVTLLRQWKREARKWYPKFHVELLHDSAHEPANGKKQSDHSESDYDTEGLLESDSDRKLSSKKAKRWNSMINRVLRSKSGLLITTYEQLRLLGDQLLNIEWGYAVLDEGHRIRNPNTEVTLVCKQLQTVHRIIMTGAPIQNKLTELWSLFDFVFPGKLGVLPVFEAEFAVPISVGGYANASPLQVSTAYRCAVVLRDLIMPYLLRRMKADVNAQLPKKTEHVLFCSLTKEQRSVYRAFLASSDVEQILDGNRNSLYGIDIMRKICNHPDLLEREHSCQNPDYGNPERSGKLKVVAEVLKVWKEQGHRVLLFAQTQQMLDILENFLVSSGYSYRRMDGLTAVKQRMALIDEFNASDDVFVFILTTKVGGLGTNLTGANRVIIFDPDWNPSTDMQARERAWRIGQKRDVTIYRLISRGTIEEKVYHRQIYKHFLTNKILKNPQQRRFFKARDMKDLFILNDDEDSRSTETSNLFGQLSEEVEIVGANKENHVKKQTCEVADAALLGEENLESHSSKAKGKEKIDQGNGDVDEETNILKNLFDANGIHSAMNHDAIMNAHDEEKMRLEEQASQVAQRAAEALRQSRMLRNRESVSVPTWTGKAGVAGAPSSVRQKFGSTSKSQLVSNARTLHESSKNEAQSSTVAGVSVGKALSSAELLARIRGNQERAVADGLEHQFGVASSSGSGTRSTSSRSTQSSTSVQPEVLIRQICSFIQQRGGRTNSAPIVEHFKDRIPSKDLPLFKNLLKEIATLQKDPNGPFWVLKPEYR